MASSDRCSMKSTSSRRFPAARSRPRTTRSSARRPSTATRRVSSITILNRICGTRCSSLRAGRASPRPLVSRSDLEVEYFDQELFNGATVYDVMTRSPRVIVSATDLVRAMPFAFTREQMNGICVDPKTVPVARAVFASAATPIYFAPLVMRTFAGQCGYQPPDSVCRRCPRRQGHLSTRARRAPALVPRLRRIAVPAPRGRRIRGQPRRTRHPR